MRKQIVSLAILFMAAMSMMAQSKVYYTKEITPESLMKIYKALGVKAKGKVAIKISTGESEETGYLRPEFIAPLVKATKGTIVECNTAYGGSRSTTESHRKEIEKRGFNAIAKVDIMDEEGSMEIPVQDNSRLRFDLVGSHLANYNFMINLAHFKGHEMGGFGGVLKNASIGVASSKGKAYIHSGGTTEPGSGDWGRPQQDWFLESMAAAAQAVHNYMKGKVLYINVMNNMSIDCDCNAHPAKPMLKDMGIMASTDPVALDRACLDMVFGHEDTDGDDARPLQNRINKLHGVHTVEHAEKIGLGSTKYVIVDLDK